MVQENTGQSVSDNVEERLEMLFGEDDAADEPEEAIDANKEYPLRDLKTIVLSIDWEITDDVMKNFITQVSALKNKYADDKVITVLLQLLGSIGEYIRINLAKSHPDSIKLLNSLFNHLEKIVRTPEINEAEKKKILANEVNKYKQLKQNLAAVKSETPKAKTESEVKTAPTGAAQTDQIMTALTEIKQILHNELKAVREELQQLNQSLKKGAS